VCLLFLVLIFLFLSIRFPGNDYRQPAPGVFKPVRNIDFANDANDSDEEMIEVVIAQPGESLPQAASTIVDDDDQPFEVEVVVDFGVTSSAHVPPAPAPSTSPTPVPFERQQSSRTPGLLERQQSSRSPLPAPVRNNPEVSGSFASDDHSCSINGNHITDEPPGSVEATPEEAEVSDCSPFILLVDVFVYLVVDSQRRSTESR
jgi:hypothetical protein